MKYKILYLILSLGLFACSTAKKSDHGLKRVGHVENQVLFSIKTANQVQNAEELQELLFSVKNPSFYQFEILSQRTDGDGYRVFASAFVKDMPFEVAKAELLKNPRIIFVAKNYIYEGNLNEQAEKGEIVNPSDLQFVDQYQHDLLQNPEAWEIAQGENIIVAVTDNGFELNHEDLNQSFHTNPGESGVDANGNDKRSNGIDDDRNGHIDDFQGWDFNALGEGDNDPSPSSSWDDHGTHVSGIIASPMNELGIVGTAPKAQVMPIKFDGSGGNNWTSLEVFNSYKYAWENGANIINTSYNINSFVDDQVYLEAIASAYQRDILIFNSAGNAGQSNPARQAFQEVLLVANTDDQDRRASSSNYGWGIDISAPGSDILSTVTNNQYRTYSGTSMAAPQAAAVAALIWSKNPEWTRDQVAAQLLGTAVSIDQMNQNDLNKIGSGRVNSFKALTETLAPPRLRGLDINRIRGGTTQLILEMGDVFDPKSVEDAVFNLSVVDSEKNKIDYKLSLNSSYRIASNRIELNLDKPLVEGIVTFSAPETLRDPFGNGLDGNQNGRVGGKFYQILNVGSHSTTQLDVLNPEFIAFCEESAGSSNEAFIEALLMAANLQEDVSFGGSDACTELALSMYGVSELHLNAWDLDGIQISDLSGLKFFDAVESLQISGHEISDLSPIQGLSQLQHLDLSWNAVGDTTVINGLTNLKTLDLSWNNLTQLSGLQNHPALERLNINGNPLSDLSGIDGLTNLTELSAANLNDGSGDQDRGLFSNLDSLGTLASLTRLDLQGNSILQIHKLRDFPELEILDLTDNLVENLDPLFELDNLKFLFTDYNPLQRSYCDDLDLFYCDEPEMNQL